MSDQVDLAVVESRRSELEQNVAKLSKSLLHWQQWEIEYEGMKEELVGIKDDHTLQNIRDLENDHEVSLTSSQPNLLDAKERKLLLYNNGKPRSAKTIINLVSKRIDYVQQNITTVDLLLSNAEERLASSTVVTQSEANKEDILPVTEIREELDEHGNVISSATSRPDPGAPQVIDVLRRAGVKETPDGNRTQKPEAIKSDRVTPGKALTPHRRSSDPPRTGISPIRAREDRASVRNRDIQTSDSSSSSSEPTKRRPGTPKKRVSFAEGTKSETGPSDHPRDLPKEAQAALLRDVCVQVRPVLGRNFKKKKMYEQLIAIDTFSKRCSTSMAMSSFLEQETVEPTLKQHQNRQARRLLKSHGLNLWEASRVLHIMTEIERFDLHCPQIVGTISALKKLHDYAPGIDSPTKPSGSDSPSAKDLEVASSKAMLATQSLEDYVSRSPSTKASNTTVPRGDEPDEASAPNDESLFQENLAKLAAPIRSAHVPDDETPEEASVRRQMLAYNMEEVGAVVAELNLDNDDDLSEGSYSHDDHIDIEESDDDENEDDYGRASSRVLTESYLEEMKALEKRLKARALVNAGPNGSITASTHAATTNGASPKSHKPADTEERHEANRTKRVSFAEELDVQEIPVSTNVISDEHKPSRFRASQDGRAAQLLSSSSQRMASVNSGDVKKTVPINAANIVERPYNPTVKAPDPDDLDPIRLNQQVNSQYHRLRNRMIEKEGGFLKPDERTQIPVEEEMTGGKKMSRFRAAKLGLQQ